jgi:hypothetical protein
MLDSEVFALLDLSYVSSIPSAHAPAQTAHFCTMLMNELYCFTTLHFISNAFVSAVEVIRVNS